MALGGFIKLIQSMSKSAKIKAYQQEQDKKTASIKNAAAQQRKALKDAEVTDIGDASQVKDAAKIDEEEKEALLRHKKETEQGVSERKKKGNIVSTFIATIVEFAETLPIVITLVQLVALFLALIIIVVIIINFIIALTTLTVDTSADLILEDSAFHFENAYQTSFKDYTDKKGVKHKSITITIPSEDPDEPPEIIVTDNIDFWLNLSDKDIEKYLVYDIEDLNQRVQTANFFRFIRMAYRICYTKNEAGEYYLKGLDPELLLGIPFFEKGYDWMQLYTQAGVLYYSYYPSYWATLDGGSKTWTLHELPEDTLDATESMAKYANVDTSISGAFIVNPDADGDGVYNFSDGPYSFSVAKEYYDRGGYSDGTDPSWFCDLFPTYVPAKYAEFLQALLKYPEYAPLSPVVDITDSGIKLTDSQHYLIGSLFFSMVLTAVRYDNEWYNTEHESRFEKRLLKLRALEGATRDNESYWLLGYASAADFTYKNTLEYYLCKLLGTETISDETLIKYERSLANCTYYTYHHMPAFAGSSRNYHVLHPIPVNEEVDVNKLLTAYERYNEQMYPSTAFYTGLGVLTTAVLAQAQGDISNYTIATAENDLDTTIVPLSAEVSAMYVPKSGLAGNFFDGRTDASWANGIDTMYTAFAATDYGSYSCYRWDLRTSNGETTPLTTSIMGAAVEKYKNAQFTSGVTLDELLTPLNFEASCAESQYYNNRAQVVEGALAPLMGALITSRWFNICADRMQIFNAPIIIETGELPEGAWVFPYSDALAVSEMLSADAPQNISECKHQNTMFPIVDLDPTAEGIQAPSGVRGYFSNGSGYYSGGTKKHNSFDFAISTASSGATIDGVWYKNLECYFDYLAYENFGAYTKDGLDRYTAEGYATLLNTLSNEEFNGFSVVDDRIPSRAIADGQILSITFNVFGSTAQTTQGNAVQIRYFLPSAASETGYDTITVLVCHLGADTGLYWMNKLEQQYGITSAQFRELATLSADITYTQANGIDGVTVPASLVGSSAPSYTISLEQDNIYVPRGSILGYMSATGLATGPHYHGSIYGTEYAGQERQGVLYDNGLKYARLFGLNRDGIKVTSSGATSGGTADTIFYYPFHSYWFSYYNQHISSDLGTLGTYHADLSYFVDQGWIIENWSETPENDETPDSS